MKKLVIVVLVVVAVGGIAGGVWAWENFGPGRPCDLEHSVSLEYVSDVRTYPTVEEALTRFGRFPGIRGDLSAESLTPTEEVAPEFGATINPDLHGDTEGARAYDIWKSGDVVETVVLDSYADGWVIGGYGGCSPIP
jgi:hypothetical protein